MRRSPRPGSAASPHKRTPNFYSDNSNSSVSVTSGDSSGHRSAGPGPGEPEGRRARGSSCGEPVLSAGVPGGTTCAGSPRQKPAPRSHKGPTACGAATVRGGASEPAGSPVVSEEQFDLLPTLDLRQEMPPPRVSKSFLSLLLRVLSVLLSLVGDVLVIVYREVCSIRFLLTALSLLSLFLAGEGVANPLGPPPWMFWSQTRHIFSCIPQHPEHLQQLTAPFRAPSRLFSPHCPFMPRKPSPLAPPETTPLSPALWWGLLYLVPPLENEPKEMLTLSEYHERVRSQGQQLQQLQAQLDKLHKEVSSVRAANSERVAKLVFQRLNEDFVRKPDYALSSVGASIDLEKTSHDYEDANTAYFWNRFSFWNYARPPTVILEVGLELGSQNGARDGLLEKGDSTARWRWDPAELRAWRWAGPCLREDGPGWRLGLAVPGTGTPDRIWLRLDPGGGLGGADGGVELRAGPIRTNAQAGKGRSRSVRGFSRSTCSPAARCVPWELLGF
ncbi:sperm-associated antigen 4 protein isoform X2 [Acinonyx jubatus]|uniref:Sperm-associated antigen 4 protein isoform X2 n=1 Tax=Acinonyx jubatus TaxID=32536 RepID=A0ABM3N995_ACIJB|nr:sperm-associated antigen 4 protein isoform X2 [Acinonyx jubatus]